MYGVRIVSVIEEVADVELSDAKQHLTAPDDQVVIITKTPHNALDETGGGGEAWKAVQVCAKKCFTYKISEGVYNCSNMPYF